MGDTIRVVFRNTCPFPTSVHPHGVFYAKSSEGAPYNDGTSGADKADDAVPTGGRHIYICGGGRRHVRGPDGPIEITARGMARPDGSSKDVHREIFVLLGD